MKAVVHRTRSMGRRSLVAAGVAALAVVVGLGVAVAYWLSTDSSNYAAAAADSLNAGPQPSLASMNGQDVTIGWSATTTAAGRAVTGYSIARYASATGGAAIDATGTCADTVTAVTCTEQDVPPGTWYYAVRARLANWVGAEGSRSDGVVVTSSTLSFTTGQTLRPPANLTGGSLSHFKSNEHIDFHLDTSAGVTLSASLATVDATGQASGFSVTIPSGASDGTHVVVAVGGLGSTATSNSFAVDSTPPTATVAFPGNGTTYAASAYNAGCTPVGLCGSVRDVTAVQSVSVSIRQESGNYWNGSTFAASGETWLATSLAASGSTSTTWSYPFTLPPDGQYTVHVRTQDSLGNTQTSTYAAASIFTVDTTAPTVTLASVNGNSATFPYSTNADLTSVGGTCGAATGDSTTVTVSITGQATQTGTATCSGGRWTYPVDPSLTAEGAYAVSASQDDSVGNSATTGAKSVTIDKTRPVVSLSTVNGTSVQFPYSTNVNITSVGGSCGVVSGDLATVNVTISGPVSVNSVATCSSGAWTLSPAALTTEGQYTIVATQSDAAGNTGTSGSQSVTLDKTAPTVTLTKLNGSAVLFPYSTNANVTSVGGTCGTATGDDRTVAISIGGAATESGTAPCSGGSWSWTLTTELSAEGSYTTSVTQSDAAGNGGTSGSRAIIVDRTAPVVTLTKVNGSVVTFPYTTNADMTSLGGACGTTPGDSSSVNVAITGQATQSGTAVCSAGSWTYTVSPTLVAEGTYSVSATQSDAAGNTGASGAKQIAIRKPKITSVALSNGGTTAGKIEAGDKIVVTFAQPMNTGSFCADWNGSTISGNNVVTVTVQDGTAQSDDSLSVTVSPCVGGFHFGTIDLGSGAYVSGGSAAFSGTGSNASSVTWSGNVLTITLGGNPSNKLTFGTVPTSTPVYTADAAITDASGFGLTNSPFTLLPGQQF